MRLNGFRTTLTLTLLLGAPCLPARGEAPDFNREIRPILADHCLACHGADEQSREADLRLDTAEGAYEWAVAPGEPDESELVSRVETDDPDLVMPPPSSKKPLSADQVALLRRWVKSGAEYDEHWAFVAPEKQDPPRGRGDRWSKNPIDRFVLARLDKEGLAPAPPADPHALGRRLSLDITGLPPSPEAIRHFVAGCEQDEDRAVSDLIDSLMATPAWGEHRARYWLDAARYADTHGLHFDNYREMWVYRDWVIRAFNENLPFDRFTIHQLAGDLLPEPTEDQRIATGFQRCNITTNEGGTIEEENLALYAADRVQTFGWVYLGLTTNCAQCHDHKFDPISMRDYYSLAAFFRNTTERGLDKNHKAGGGETLVVPAPADRDRWIALPEEIAAATVERDARRESARKGFESWDPRAGVDLLKQNVPTEGLALHAPLDRVEGPALSVVAGGEATTSKKPKQEIRWVASGKLGPAPLFGADAVLAVEAPFRFDLEDAFSYALWVRPSEAANKGPLIRCMTLGEKRHGWELVLDKKKYSAHLVDNRINGLVMAQTRQESIKRGEWQHLVVTYEGERRQRGIKIYIDGKLQDVDFPFSSLPDKASISSDEPIKLGGKTDPKPTNDIAIQGVRVYDRVLSEQEARDLYDSVEMAPLLAAGAPAWTEPQRERAFDYYLRCVDQEHRTLAAELRGLQQEQEKIRERSPLTHVQQEKGAAPMAHVLMRGAYDSPGEEVPAAPPAALHPLPEGAPANRLGLAQWVVDPANPLTARVTVNRFWQEVFGQGLVATPEDFGVMGSPPINQELLDWLAVDFRENGWDVKRLFKKILSSAAYRQAAVNTPEKIERDDGNALLSRGPRFRMDAEMIRDSALAASGLLVARMYGPGARPYQPEGVWDVVGMPGGDTRNYKQDEGDNLYRRSVYSFWKRMAPPPNLEAFNAPSREVCTVRRERTNTPLQALVTLNDPQFVEAARALAARVLEQAGDDPAAAIERIAWFVVGRPLSEMERAILLESHRRMVDHYASRPEAAAALIAVGDSPLPEGVDPTRLAAWTMVCSEVMNLDEALTK